MNIKIFPTIRLPKQAVRLPPMSVYRLQNYRQLFTPERWAITPNCDTNGQSTPIFKSICFYPFLCWKL